MSAVVEDTAQILVDAAAAAGANAEQWANHEWRLDNLYWIVNKDAQTVRFQMNDQQRRFIERLWTRNLILKARQLGFSTLIAILQLDQALFVPNHNGVVIADTLPNASKLFGKAEFAYDHLPELLREALPVLEKNKGSKITIEHLSADGKTEHSTVSVGVSARGGTVNLLHVSELGKIALKFPQRAEEIKTGALPAVPRDGITVIESTAEGAFGLFWELCEPAIKRWHEGSPETELDWRLHFFPWFEAEEYRLSEEDTALVDVPSTLTAYFHKLEVDLGITIDRTQRAWYAKTRETLGKKMKQEYPATPEEAFEQAIEGSIYGEQMTWLRENDRLGVVPLHPHYPVNTFWDFGVSDMTAIWFHQLVGQQHRWFRYFEKNGKGLHWWWVEFMEEFRHLHKFKWGKHFLPHDADAEILGEVVTTKRRILEGLGMGHDGGGAIVVVPRIATIGQGIELTRQALQGNHWFDKRKPDFDKGEDMGAGHGITCLDGYQFTWDPKRGVWSSEPLHNWASHGSDAWRQFAQGWRDDSLDQNSSSLITFKNRARRGL